MAIGISSNIGLGHDGFYSLDLLIFKSSLLISTWAETENALQVEFWASAPPTEFSFSTNQNSCFCLLIFSRIFLNSVKISSKCQNQNCGTYWFGEIFFNPVYFVNIVKSILEKGKKKTLFSNAILHLPTFRCSLTKAGCLPKLESRKVFYFCSIYTKSQCYLLIGK